MKFSHWITLFSLLSLLTLLRKPLGLYLSQIFDPKEKTFLDPLLGKVERRIYRLCHINPEEEESAREYLFSVLIFSFSSLVFVFLVLQMQGFLPLNPEHFPSPSMDLNFNTAVSFITNTNWQNYSGEKTLSYFSQMTALAVQNFLSPAVGLSVLAALTRGLSRHKEKTVGNFFTDLIRSTLYLFLPLAWIFSLFLLWQGVPQNFQPYQKAICLETHRPQLIVQGPIASQEAIKLLGTNGGGYTNTNSAHPYENPTPLCNFLQILALLLIPAAQTFYFGKEIKNAGHGWTLYLVMCSLFILGVFLCSHAEEAGTPLLKEISHLSSSPNMEGKEVRFGIFDSTLFATATTATSTGATNSSHTCYTPLGGLIPLLNMELGEILFGGVGSGLYDMVIFIIISIFLAGLMVGRTPDYLGKRLESGEIKMTMLAMLTLFTTILGFTAFACTSPESQAAINNQGPHGLTEILYAFTSCAANNGSAFAGSNFNIPWYNITLSLAMLVGRFCVLIPILLLAGLFVKKGKHPTQEGFFPVAGMLFFFLLTGVIIIIGALTYSPPLVLGPIFEHFDMVRKIFH